MRIKLYMDEDSMDHALVQGLRARGVDVMTALDAGLIEVSDARHLDHATRLGRVLCSFNVSDFASLHADSLKTGTHHSGIAIAFQQRLKRSDHLCRLLRLVATLTAEEMIDRLEYLTAWS